MADEGVTLRRNGITSNIMVMNPEMTAFKTMFDYDLEPEVYSFQLSTSLLSRPPAARASRAIPSTSSSIRACVGLDSIRWRTWTS